MQQLNQIIDSINTNLWNVLIIILLAVGIFFSCSTRFVQIRLFLQSIREIKSGINNNNLAQGLTPFQAFVIGLASRVGVGNIAGVAIAIGIGGPGAVFWMWLTALLGMSSAFAESSLAQLFKVKDSSTKLFRGGPAYYISTGLKQPWLASLFAIILIITYGFVFNSLQANTIIDAGNHAWNWNKFDFDILGFPISIVGILLVVFTGLCLFGGLRRVARTTEYLVPIMAIIYLIITLVILLLNYTKVPQIIALIFCEAFNFGAATGGLFGGLVSQAMMQGIKRGLFSNEAGMGSAPNAAATSNAKHPVNQGLIQMLGVFFDTMIVCTCTAVIILISGVYQLENIPNGIQLTQTALEQFTGSFGTHYLALTIFLFAFTSILGNYAYAESNIQFVINNKTILNLFRSLVLAMVYFGCVASIPLVWNMADLFMAMMAFINLIAISCLAPLVWLMLNDYSQQLKDTPTPQFKLDRYPAIKAKIKSDIW